MLFKPTSILRMTLIGLLALSLGGQSMASVEHGPIQLAQTPEEDGEEIGQMFESMESNQPKENKTEKSLAQRFWDNKTLKVISWNDGYLHSPSDERTHSANLIGTQQLYFKSQLNLQRDVFLTEIRYEWSNLESAYDQDAIFKQSEAKRRNRFHIKQLYYTWTFDNYDISLGKKLVDSGKAELFSPSDRYNRPDLTDPVHPRSEGVWESSINYYHEDATTRFHFMPAYEPSRTPPEPSRWSATQTGKNFNTNFNTFDNSTTELPTAEPTDWQYLLEHERTYPGWDVYGQIFHGQFGPVVFRDGGQYRQEYFKVLTLASGFKIIQDRWKYYGEALYQTPYDEVDDAFVKGVVGAKYSFDESVRPYGLKKVELTGEYAHEKITNDFDDPDVLSSTKKTRPGRKSYLFKSSFKKTEDLSYILATEIDRAKKTEFYGLGMKYHYSGNLILNAWAEFFNADEDSQLSHWSDNDRLVFTAEYFVPDLLPETTTEPEPEPEVDFQTEPESDVVSETSPEPEPEIKPDEYFEKGREAFRQENYKKSIEHFETATEGRPDHANTLFWLGLARYEVGELQKATEKFERILELEPENKAAKNNLEKIRNQLIDPEKEFKLSQKAFKDGDYETAHRHLQKALRGRPEHVNTLFYLGIVEYQLGKVDSARDRFKRVLELSPDNETARHNLELIRKQQ